MRQLNDHNFAYVYHIVNVHKWNPFPLGYKNKTKILELGKEDSI